jgi:two-component system sensor histidine kinase KdpD
MQMADRPRWFALPGNRGVTGGYLLAIVGSVAAIAVAALVERWLGVADLSLVFMLAVLVVASCTHTGPAVVTAMLCFLAYNFFFIEPRFTLYIGARNGVVTVALFLAAALLAGRLAAQLSMQIQALRVANDNAIARQELGQRLSVAANEEDVVQAAHATLGRALDAAVWVRLGNRGLHVEGVEPPALPVLRQVDSMEEPARHVETIEEFGWWFLPLRAPDGVIGVIGLKLPPYLHRLDEAQRQLARSMADDIAQALLRTRLVADLQSERVANESERLRTALLSSVSHDLRTPLAAIIGAAGSLDSYGNAMDETDRHSLLETVRVEGERLDRYIQNLLDMTRLGHGELALQRDWIGIDELIGSATGRMRRYQPNVRFTIMIDPGIGPIWVHPALIEQALFNVIENAARFSPSGQSIAIEVQRAGDDRLRIDIRDWGPGIPEGERRRIFDMFYSAERGDRGGHGTGLGLAICRGMIGAHGGEVDALRGADGVGTIVRIMLPLLKPSSVVDA